VLRELLVPLGDSPLRLWCEVASNPSELMMIPSNGSTGRDMIEPLRDRRRITWKRSGRRRLKNHVRQIYSGVENPSR
jgi:hypothetical protein